MKYYCAVAAIGLWVVTWVLVFRDWLTTGHADWVPFAAFSGLIILIAIPTVFGDDRDA